MATVLRLPLSVLILFATILASFPYAARAKLRTGVPYYMVPYNWAIGGGVAPARVGNEYCPSTVVFAPEIERGIPVIFSTPEGEDVFIGEDTEVYISFYYTLDGCTSELLGPWGRPLLGVPSSNVTFIDLYGFGSEFSAYAFRIKKMDGFYKVVSYRAYGGSRIVLQPLNIVPVYDSKHHIKSRLILTPESPEGSPILFFIFEAEAEDEDMKSIL